MPKFSLIIDANNTTIQFFRDLLESVADQINTDWQLVVLDSNDMAPLKRISEEFFPSDYRLIYRNLKNYQGTAYAYNIGTRLATGEYLLFVGQHDRLSPNTLLEIDKIIEGKNPENTLIYSDHDELVEMDRMNPHFKNGFNKELLLHTQYIGEFFCVGAAAHRKIGNFAEILKSAFVYDYFLRAMSAKLQFLHVPSLIYHRRVTRVDNKKEQQKKLRKKYLEHVSVIKAHFLRTGVKAEIIEDKRMIKWDIKYDTSDYHKNSRNIMLLKSPDVRVITRKSVERLYGYIKQPDVAVAGVRFISGPFTIDNCGYIYNNIGDIQPAFYGQKMYLNGYENMDVIPHDVSSVDDGYCLINQKVYNGLGGMNALLPPREAMLDFCIRARAAGYRTVIEPAIMARHKAKVIASSQESYELFMNRNRDTIALGDPYYNENLPFGLSNYVLPYMEENIDL